LNVTVVARGTSIGWQRFGDALVFRNIFFLSAYTLGGSVARYCCLASVALLGGRSKRKDEI
jgi:hypothetical protein